MIFQEFNFQVVAAVMQVFFVKRLSSMYFNVLYTKPTYCCKIQGLCELPKKEGKKRCKDGCQGF